MARRDDVWLRELYDAQWVPMVRLATLLLGSSDTAEEIVQDALVAVYQRRSHFESLEHAQAYLRVAVVNRTRSAHRHRVVAHRYLADSGPETASPEQLAADHETSSEVLGLVDSLPQRQREVLVLSFYLDLSEADIADTLGISRGAVRSHAHRGLQAVRTGRGEGSGHD